MNRQQVNLTFGITPIAMSLMALALVIVAVTTGWQTNLPDEGLAAHLFQLLMFTQPVIVLVFLATADWKRPARAAGFLALHVLGAALALGTLRYFESNGPL